ncbi:MAG: two component transcriptional regulator, LytTR family [Bacteroidetes bacterium]|jgi:two-component system LytT family response regulator|nr:two component transcriptional regulator, LytTR family [Bacteroidota bacterium]
MIRTIIVEDEYFGQELLKKHLSENFPETMVVATESTVSGAVEAINLHKPDLVLLDIQILGGTGFDVLKGIKNRNFELIFITAFNQYAIDAIKNDASDYILKPIKANEFATGMKKCIDRINTRSAPLRKDQTFPINTSIGIEYLPENDILYFEADGTYTNVVCEHKKMLSSKNIGEYEKQLDKAIFFRTHHSYIINCKKIKKFEKGRSGRLIMSNGNEIPVSQRRIKEFTLFIDSI